jgi:hypothetical protein
VVARPSSSHSWDHSVIIYDSYSAELHEYASWVHDKNGSVRKSGLTFSSATPDEASQNGKSSVLASHSNQSLQPPTCPFQGASLVTRAWFYRPPWSLLSKINFSALLSCRFRFLLLICPPLSLGLQSSYVPVQLDSAAILTTVAQFKLQIGKDGESSRGCRQQD